MATRTLYPWEQLNERIDKGGNKQPPSFADAIPLPSGGFAWISKKTDSLITIIYYHGNGETAVDLLDSGMLAYFERKKYNWAVIDYAGVGIGGIKPPNEKNNVQMGSEVLTAVLRRVNPAGVVIVWGRSMGAAVASQVAMKRKPFVDALILISPWTNLRDLMRRNFVGRFVSKKFHVEHSYSTDDICKTYGKATLIVHGTADELIPYDMGQSLRSCFKPSTLQTVTGYGHNNIYGSPEVFPTIEAFIQWTLRLNN